MRATWLSGLAAALQLNFGLERKTPRGGPAHAARCPEWQMAFSVARACVASRAMRGSRGSVTGRRWLTPPLGPGQGNACGWPAAPASKPGLGLPVPATLDSFCKCVCRTLSQASQRGNADPQREFVLGEVEKECGSWLRGCKARAEKEGGGKKGKWLPLGGRLL